MRTAGSDEDQVVGRRRGSAEVGAPGRGPQINRSVTLNQLLFGSAVLAVVVALQWFSPERLISSTVFAGVVLAFVASGAALVVPWNRFDKRWIALLPVADMLVIFCLRLGVPEIGVGVLWVLPIIWLSTYFGLFGTTLSIALALSGSWGVLILGPHSIRLSSMTLLVLLPIALSFVAASTHLSARRGSAQRVLMRKQSTLLAHALASANQHERLLTEVLNTVTFGIVRFDRGGEITLINRAHRRMHVSSGRASAPPVMDVVYQSDRVTPFREEDRPYVRAQQGQPFDGVLIWTGHPGQERHAYLMTARRLYDSGGAFDGTILVSGEVTAEINAIAARDDLISSVSHELRTPLTSILGYLDLALERDDLPEDARGWLEIVERNSTRLLDLVSEILTSSSRAAKPLEISPVPMDLGEVVLQSAESLLPRAAERAIDLATSDVENHLAVADPFRMRQVVDNVLSNAIKYNREAGSIVLALGQAGDRLILTVTDTGIGISADEVPKLFDNFFRSEAVRNTGVHGSGLGMGIAREIVRKHGGELTVASTLGKGTTVTIEIPKKAVT
ncbi:Signal transduction histidine kinase [Sanguibacter gelidistatuariae]|uniref:histidine kinase n=1 Tax=Sanguibacter gelidistatuariae TaxID=1814289 RepID=A0A1G6H6K1_9MICO|nr:PAS domain-containing sensor histidine kinase [Sanguibacter gelidistatuariae]SDB89887.1 Signal transduction histidine kinase [Sanguibacter gelidistatuariae]